MYCMRSRRDPPSLNVIMCEPLKYSHEAGKGKKIIKNKLTGATVVNTNVIGSIKS